MVDSLNYIFFLCCNLHITNKCSVYVKIHWLDFKNVVIQVSTNTMIRLVGNSGVKLFYCTSVSRDNLFFTIFVNFTGVTNYYVLFYKLYIFLRNLKKLFLVCRYPFTFKNWKISRAEFLFSCRAYLVRPIWAI